MPTAANIEKINGISFGAGVAVSGGTESTYSSGGVNYKVHTFTSSATLNIVSAVDVDYLVIAGGGGVAGGISGGGGAGGYRTGTLTLSAAAYAVLVGGGGAAGGNNSGANSVLSSITSLGGGGSNGVMKCRSRARRSTFATSKIAFSLRASCKAVCSCGLFSSLTFRPLSFSINSAKCSPC